MHQKGGIFYGWWVLIACSIMQFYIAGTFMNGFTAFFNPLVNEFKWSYTLVSLALTFRGFETGFMAPVVGLLVDRFRPQRLLIAGTIMAAAGFFVFSRVQALWSFYIAFLLLGLAASLSSQVVIMTTIATWFKKRTGTAMGIMSTGSAAGGLLVPLIILLIDSQGWRETLEFFAIGSLVISLPLCFVVKDPPPETIDTPTLKASREPKPKTDKLKIRDILKQKNFWLLSIALLCAGVGSNAIAAHKIPYLVSVGLTRETGGWLVLVFSLSNIVGRLVFGWLGDMMDKRKAFMLTGITAAVGLVIFAYARTLPQFFPAVILVGIGQGGVVPLRPVLQLQFFGFKSFATVQGLTLVLVTLGTIASPPFTGWVYDSFKNYQPAWLTLAVFAILIVPIILSTSKQPANTTL